MVNMEQLKPVKGFENYYAVSNYLKNKDNDKV